jgi:hypothetical protein
VPRVVPHASVGVGKFSCEVDEGPIRRPERGSEWEPIKILLQRTRPKSQSQLQKSHTNTNRQDNVVMDKLQVIGTIPQSTRGSTRKDAKEQIKLGKFLCTDRTVRLAAADCSPGRGGLFGRADTDCLQYKSPPQPKIASLCKRSAERSVTPR